MLRATWTASAQSTAQIWELHRTTHAQHTQLTLGELFWLNKRQAPNI